MLAPFLSDYTELIIFPSDYSELAITPPEHTEVFSLLQINPYKAISVFPNLVHFTPEGCWS